MKIEKVAIYKILDDITEMLDRTDKILHDYPNLYVKTYDVPEQIVENCIEESFIQILSLIEAIGYPKIYDQINRIYKEAQKDKYGYLKIKLGIDDEPYLIYSFQLRRFLNVVKDITNYPKRKDKKKLRPNQQAKKKCREIAKKIWEKEPKKTIAAMIDHPEIIPHKEKKDETLYTDKTVRNWIKTLCPNRSPGLRPKR